MSVQQKNRYLPDLWKRDSQQSVDYYNEWFIRTAPEAYRVARTGVIKRVKKAISILDFLNALDVEKLKSNPQAIEVLRACTAPPLAVDRLAGLSYTTRSVINSLEDGRIPKSLADPNDLLGRMITIIQRLLDYDIFPWIKEGRLPSSLQLNRSSSIIADRITGALANPLLRNWQEERQLAVLTSFLERKGYTRINNSDITSLREMPTQTFSIHTNVPVNTQAGMSVNMPIDVVIQPINSSRNGMPLLVECKSAGDFTNTNKRRKEEAMKVTQLRHTYGEDSIVFILFLCGYFDASYLGYEASEGIDWVWEHRIDDFSSFGV